MYLKDQVTEGKRELPCPRSLLTWWQQLGLDRAETKSPGRPQECRGPRTWTVFRCLPQRISREMDWNRNSQDSNQCPYDMLVLLGCRLTRYVTTQAPSMWMLFITIFFAFLHSNIKNVFMLIEAWNNSMLILFFKRVILQNSFRSTYSQIQSFKSHALLSKVFQECVYTFWFCIPEFRSTLGLERNLNVIQARNIFTCGFWESPKLHSWMSILFLILIGNLAFSIDTVYRISGNLSFSQHTCTVRLSVPNTALRGPNESVRQHGQPRQGLMWLDLVVVVVFNSRACSWDTAKFMII